MNRSTRIIGVVIFTSVLSACSQQDADKSTASQAEVKPVSKELLLTQRAEDRWQALIAWDMEKAYAYLSPGTREAMPLPVYMKKQAVSPFQMTDAVVKNTQCGEQVCTLKMELRYIYNGTVAAMRGQEDITRITEKWIEADGNWFYMPN
ncbi:MAG: hypothetical protein GY806_21510 [Gammaproteobacteria bacterium]|nr:hypothetical protein [Gammaproteobacteria bacterium]